MLALGNNKLSPQQRLDKAVVAIMGNEKYRALAGILMIGDRSIKGDCPYGVIGFNQYIVI